MKADVQPRALCLSVHDVCGDTLPQCEILLKAVERVAPVRITWLVVPAWHHHCASSPALHDFLEARRLQGDELALHGYTHLDEGPQPDCRVQAFLRHVYTQGEGEFAALSEEQARQRIQWGLQWFAAQGWQPQGFVPPAWLLSSGAWRALQASDLAYTTSYTRFWLLPSRQSVWSPSIVYSARSGWGSAVSRAGMSLLAKGLRQAPLLRLSLHPRDVLHPASIRHTQSLLEKLLAQRASLTKFGFAQGWAQRHQGLRLGRDHLLQG